MPVHDNIVIIIMYFSSFFTRLLYREREYCVGTTCRSVFKLSDKLPVELCHGVASLLFAAKTYFIRKQLFRGFTAYSIDICLGSVEHTSIIIRSLIIDYITHVSTLQWFSNCVPWNPTDLQQNLFRARAKCSLNRVYLLENPIGLTILEKYVHKYTNLFLLLRVVFRSVDIRSETRRPQNDQYILFFKDPSIFAVFRGSAVEIFWEPRVLYVGTYCIWRTTDGNKELNYLNHNVFPAGWK